MNVIVFCLRAGIGCLFGLMCIYSLTEGEIIGTLANLSATIVILLPLARVLYFHQKLLPASVLTKGFTVQKRLRWTRVSFGFLFAFSGSGNILAKDYSGTGVLLLGLFLLAPFSSNRVFTYDPSPVQGAAATAPWNKRMTRLVIIRTLGLTFILFGLGSYLDTSGDIKNPYIFGHVLITIGVLLVFIRQMGLLFNRGKTAGNEAEPVVGGATGIGAGMGMGADVVEAVGVGASTTTVGNAGATATVASAGVGMDVVEAVGGDLQRLSGEYMTLLQLEPGKKGPAYGDFLNKLFALYDFSARSDFRVNGNEINGSFELDGQTYILLAKWQEQKNGHDDLLLFNGKVEARSTWARGIFISDAGFTNEGLETFARGKRTSIIGMDGQDIRLILGGTVSLVEAIKRKARRAVETNHSFVPLQKLI